MELDAPTPLRDSWAPDIMHASILNELLISSSQVGDVNKVHTDPDQMSL